MDFDYRTQGIEELLKTFRNLPKSLRRKAIRKGLKRGMNVVKKAAIENVRSQVSSEASGTLAKNIVTASLKNHRGMMRSAVRIRPKAVNQIKKDAEGKPVRVGLYGAVLEYGKANQAPRSFLRKAAREKTAEAADAVRIEIRAGMIEAIKDSK